MEAYKPELPTLKLDVYTDGSHYGDKLDKSKADKRHVGMGIYINYDGVDYEFASRCDGALAEAMVLTKEEIGMISNPTAEFMAFAIAYGLLLQIAKQLHCNVELTFINDYTGVENWMTGKWKTKKLYIKKIKEWADHRMCDFIEQNEVGEIKIMYKHVKGHSGVEGNERADVLAKNPNPVNTMSALQVALFDKFKLVL